MVMVQLISMNLFSLRPFLISMVIWMIDWISYSICKICVFKNYYFCYFSWDVSNDGQLDQNELGHLISAMVRFFDYFTDNNHFIFSMTVLGWEIVKVIKILIDVRKQ
jgi:hypothetical protein